MRTADRVRSVHIFVLLRNGFQFRKRVDASLRGKRYGIRKTPPKDREERYGGNRMSRVKYLFPSLIGRRVAPTRSMGEMIAVGVFCCVFVFFCVGQPQCLFLV